MKGTESKTERVDLRVTPSIKKWLRENGGAQKVIDKLIQEARNK